MEIWYIQIDGMVLMTIDENFKRKRKAQSFVIEEAIRDDNSISKTFNALINQYSIITYKDIEGSRETGYITVQDLENNEVIGFLYVRKYSSLNQESSYNIELLLNNVNSKTSDNLPETISKIYNTPFCCIKLDSMPDMTIVVFGNSNSKQIYKEIASEYATSGRIYLLQEGKVYELQNFISNGDKIAAKVITLQDLITYVNQEDEDDFELELPSKEQRLKLSEK